MSLQPTEQPGVEFTVYGQPVPQGSKKVIRGNVVEMADARLRSWRQDVATTAKAAMAGASPLIEPVNVRLVFFLARPKGHYGTGRNAGTLKPSAPIAPGVKPDLDKLARAVLDALTGICFRDDCQVVGLSCSKLYAHELNTLGLMVSVAPLQ